MQRHERLHCSGAARSSVGRPEPRARAVPSVLPIDRVLAEIDRSVDEIVACAVELIRIPTVNPPGDAYEPCAHAIGDRLRRHGLEVSYHEAAGRPEHTLAHPRVNVVGLWRGGRERPLVHLNGHFDVVPPGDGWTVDPFGGVVRDGRVYGRGSADMKGGIASAIFAVEAIRRVGYRIGGSIEISGTVDEESGGLAGVAWLAEAGRIHKRRTDHVIIPEPLDVDRICVGHRGVHWFRLTTHGRVAHGSMPFLGRNAIDDMGRILESFRTTLVPALAGRSTSMPVVPPDARHPTLNINAIAGGQPVGVGQTPCVADRCSAVFDRRFTQEEGFDAARAEVVALLERVKADCPGLQLDMEDLLIVHPVRTPDDSPLIHSLEQAAKVVLGVTPSRVASPGTYDHKHVTRLGGIEHCVAYGPGHLELAHQPDEWCGVEDMVSATKVLALAILDLVGTT